MEKIFFISLLVLSWAYAKPPENADSFVCPSSKKKKEATKPVYLHQTNEKFVFGICGQKEKEAHNFSDIDVYVFPDAKKPIFSNYSKNKKFLVVEKRDGILLIEKVKVDNEYVELFRHELDCDQDHCKPEKEMCIATNKIKQNWIFKKTKDSKIKNRMKKLGCT